jgi:hypothetical protein
MLRIPIGEYRIVERMRIIGAETERIVKYGGESKEEIELMKLGSTER